MNDLTQLSKFIALILRHKPESVGLTLRDGGWVDVHELIEAINSKSSFKINFDILRELVETDKKERYSFSMYYDDIRANQGHSAPVKMTFAKVIPPEFLYHGTPWNNVSDIMEEGIKKMSRHHVHLSKDIATARTVGERRGHAKVLTIHSKIMYDNGYDFLMSENGVYLIDHVPATYITVD